jgi:hypothetical protein
MRNKKERRLELRVELRPNAAEVLKPEKMRVDAWAVVERSGMVLRWALSEASAESMKARMLKGEL